MGVISKAKYMQTYPGIYRPQPSPVDISYPYTTCPWSS